MKTLLAVILLFPLVAIADVGQVTFGVPTQREDGTSLPEIEIGGIRLYSEINSWEFPYKDATGGTVNPIVNGEMIVEITLAAGTYVFNATCYDTEGRESLFSDPFTVVAKARPGRPTTIKVKVLPQ